MTNIYLVRHAEKIPNGKALTKRGIKQAKFLGKRLSKLKIEKIYSSPLPRVKQTTEIIQKYVKAKTIYDPSLEEARNFLDKKSKSYQRDLKSAKRFYNKLIKQKKTILVVSSGNTNRLLFSFVMGIEPKKALILQNPTGVAHIEKIKTKKHPILTSTNDLCHLPEKLKIKQGY